MNDIRTNLFINEVLNTTNKSIHLTYLCPIIKETGCNY